MKCLPQCLFRSLPRNLPQGLFWCLPRSLTRGLTLLLTTISHSQEIPAVLQQQMEILADRVEEQPENDGLLLRLEKFIDDPVNINRANADELKELEMLNELQISSLLQYRRLLGDFIDIHELQAVPFIHLETIRMLLPYITIRSRKTEAKRFWERFRGGTHSFLLRVAGFREKAKGYDPASTGTRYLGSPLKIFSRYRYSYKQVLQFGWCGDKDAGEGFFSKAQPYGFDFNSFHLFARKAGPFQALALGDFTVNMGQGLIQWQSMAFTKSGETMNVKRQSPVLRPYNSAGEYNFYRGIGLTWEKKNVEFTGFASFRKLSANLVEDSLLQRQFVSSIQTSGYHRTQPEVYDKNVLQHFATGASLRYKKMNWAAGMNLVHHKYSLPVEKRDEWYNLYSIRGDRWFNASVDYSFTYRNFHFFGEAAVDMNRYAAFLNGCIISADRSIDISFVSRRISSGYQAINANAFTENSMPSNEYGLYAGIVVRISDQWKLEGLSDFYRFPWLKYLVNAPGNGSDFMIRLTYTPGKKLEVQGRLGRSVHMANAPVPDEIKPLAKTERTTVQIRMNYVISRSFTLRSRLQMLALQGEDEETGFSWYVDGIYKPPMKPFSLSGRLQYFETGGYNSRLYAYENDVLYSQGIPAMFGTGYRYYLILQVKPAKNISVGMRWAGTAYVSQESIGTGLEVINGNLKNEFKAQVIFSINQ